MLSKFKSRLAAMRTHQDEEEEKEEVKEEKVEEDQEESETTNWYDCNVFNDYML